MSPALRGLIVVAVILAVIHLLGGARSHRRYYREHGTHPSLFWTYGLGWYGSFSLGGWRIGHRVGARFVLTVAVVIAVAVLVIGAGLAGHHA